MANRLQLKRGSGAPGGIFYEGEPVYDKTGKVLYVGDNGAGGSGAGSSIASANAYSSVLEILNKASSTASGNIRLYEDTDNGTNYVAVAASALIASNYTLTLPNGTGSDGQVLKTDGSGNLAWVNQTSGYSGFSITDGSTSQTIASGNTITFTGGDGIGAVVSATDILTISADLKANGGIVFELNGSDNELAVDLSASSITGTLAVGDGGTGATSALDARAGLGVSIGTDVQAFNAILADLAGLTQAADKLPYFDSNQTAATTDLSSFGRSLIDDADASAARTTLGVDAAGTDNSTDVTLVTTSHDYLSISGQAITLNAIDLAADVTGTLPNAGLANSTITVSDGSNSTATALGGTITFSGTTHEVTVAEASGTVTVSLPDDVTIGQDLSVTRDLTVSGNLNVIGTAVTFSVETTKVEDRVFELGLVNGAAPSSATTWDLGVAFNYNSSGPKKAGVAWLDNGFMAMLSQLSESADTGNADPQITATAYAPVASAGLYVGGITSGDQVINSSKEAVNLTFDGGTY